MADKYGETEAYRERLFRLQKAMAKSKSELVHKLTSTLVVTTIFVAMVAGAIVLRYQFWDSEPLPFTNIPGRDVYAGVAALAFIAVLVALWQIGRHVPALFRSAQEVACPSCNATYDLFETVERFVCPGCRAPLSIRNGTAVVAEPESGPVDMGLAAALRAGGGDFNFTGDVPDTARAAIDRYLAMSRTATLVDCRQRIKLVGELLNDDAGTYWDDHHIDVVAMQLNDCMHEADLAPTVAKLLRSADRVHAKFLRRVNERLEREKIDMMPVPYGYFPHRDAILKQLPPAVRKGFMPASLMADDHIEERGGEILWKTMLETTIDALEGASDREDPPRKRKKAPPKAS